MTARTQSDSLHLRGLGQSYSPGRWALRDVSTTVPAGSTLAVLGPSGSGKSTLLRLVAGLETPATGEVILGDRSLSGPGSAAPPERRDMSMVFQDYALWPHLTVGQIIGYGLRHGVHRVGATERTRRVGELVDFLHLSGLEQRRPAELSGGQRQRVAIARALATRPRLLLFDEPLSNLDVRLRDEMREELATLLRRLGTTALYVTHDVSEALALADRILVLHDGRVVQEAGPQDMFTRPASGWVAGLAGFSCRLSVQALLGDGDTRTARIGRHHLTGRYCGADAVGGQQPSAYLHPDAVQLSEAPDGLPGEVMSSMFAGRHHRVKVSLGQSGSVIVCSTGPRTPGERVAVVVEPGGVLLFGGVDAESRLPSPGDAQRPDTADGQHSNALHRSGLG